MEEAVAVALAVGGGTGFCRAGGGVGAADFGVVVATAVEPFVFLFLWYDLWMTGVPSGARATLVEVVFGVAESDAGVAVPSA